MFRGIIVAFIEPVVDSISNILGSLLVNKAFQSVFSLLFFASLTDLAILSLFIPFVSISVPPPHLWGIMTLTASISLFSIFLYYKALTKMDVSIVAALFSLSSIIIPIMSYFLIGEKLLLSQYIGFIIVIFFSIFISINRESKVKFNSGFWLMLVASIGVSIMTVLSKKILNEIAFTDYILFMQILTFFILCLCLVLKEQRKNVVSSFKVLKSYKYLFISMEIALTIALISRIFALSVIPATVSSAIGSSQPIFTLLFGIVLYHIFGDKFKEDISRKDVIKKIFCFVMIAIGIIFTIKG